MSLLSINTFGAVPSSSSAALTPEQPPKHLTSNDEIDLALIRQGYDRGAWSRSLTEEEAASNTTAGAIKRSRARLTVTSSPSGADLCAFGRALPPNLVTIVISIHIITFTTPHPPHAHAPSPPRPVRRASGANVSLSGRGAAEP